MRCGGCGDDDLYDPWGGVGKGNHMALGYRLVVDVAVAAAVVVDVSG